MEITRNEHFQLKDGKQKEFVHLFDSQILPVMRQQAGFKNEVTLMDSNRALVISFWDERRNADTYQASVYPKLLEKLNPIIQGPPKVETYEIAATTLAA